MYFHKIIQNIEAALIDTVRQGNFTNLTVFEENTTLNIG